MTNGYISGKFQGILGGAKGVNISNGEFRVPIQLQH